MPENRIPESDGGEPAFGFAYRARKDGTIEISRDGSPVSILRGRVAAAFLARVAAVTAVDAQHVMARATGNYRRGNERRAGRHDRNRGP